MSELTTEHVRAQYARQENYDQFYEGDLFDTPDGQVSAGDFDRWLAAHDAAIWDQVTAYQTSLGLIGTYAESYTQNHNPYR